ncbi:Fanconi anemia group C protein [Lampris incognitus]|uniref:Fanconi anemia group C protein n=1 Tax=Lampris incognitus TaxID=2546036 RepID=UPI0024B5CD21|nr:Fanconi anemia group C protein [Lampris incognitus]
MSQLQPQPQAEPLVDAQEVQFWMEKVVAWGCSESRDNQRDICLYLGRLKALLQRLLTHINNLSSTAETMRRLPFLGQFLGRLCWNPFVTADALCRKLLLQSLWGLYSVEPSNAVERKANQWIRNVLCQLATEDDDTAAQALLKHMGISPKEYHLKVLRKMVASLTEEIKKSCSFLGGSNQRCSCGSVLAVSEACVPLVTCSEVAPLINMLLQRPANCVRATLSQPFLDAVSSAYASQCLTLEDQAVVSLWCHSLPSLEEAVISLLESALTKKESTPQCIEQQLARSILPKACAQHCSLFLVVSDIFRTMARQVEGSLSVLSFLHSFTSCFLKELTPLQPQSCVSLKVFFPHAPHNLLIPLLTQPSQMPQDAWKAHLMWISGSLQLLTEEEEEGNEVGGTRGQCAVFEAWFLFVQCAHWVQMAVQLLVFAEPEDCGPLLWLLTFYHHPTNRGHHRTLQLVNAKKTWEHLRALSLVSAPPPPADHHLQALVELLSSHPQQPTLAPLLVLSLSINFAVLSQNPLSRATEILRTVLEQSGLVGEAACVLSSAELSLNGGGCLSSDANSVQLRIKALQDTLICMHVAPHCDPKTHAHMQMES